MSWNSRQRWCSSLGLWTKLITSLLDCWLHPKHYRYCFFLGFWAGKSCQYQTFGLYLFIWWWRMRWVSSWPFTSRRSKRRWKTLHSARSETKEEKETSKFGRWPIYATGFWRQSNIHSQNSMFLLQDCNKLALWRIYHCVYYVKHYINGNRTLQNARISGKCFRDLELRK